MIRRTAPYHIPGCSGLRAIGYWVDFRQEEPPYPPFFNLVVKLLTRACWSYPNPVDHIDETWDLLERTIVARYLRMGRVVHGGYGYAWCRICGVNDNGYRDLSDGTFVWPEGFAHYVEKHSVRPPKEFVEHVMTQIRKEGNR